MKIKINLKSESMDVQEFMEDAQSAAEYLRTQLNKMFDESYSTDAYIPKSGISSSCLMVDIYNVPVGSTNLQRLNSTMNMRFMMHLSNDSGKLVPKDKFELELDTWSYQLKNKGLKYRKISAKSPLEVATKFMKWLEANKLIIKSL